MAEVETNLATVEDVEKRLDAELDADARTRVEALLEEATVLVEGYLGTVPEPVPRAVRVVVSRMVAQVIESPDTGFFTESESVSAGPFSKNVTFASGGNGGAPWLSSSAKTTLRRFRSGGGLYTLRMG